MSQRRAVVNPYSKRTSKVTSGGAQTIRRPATTQSVARTSSSSDPPLNNVDSGVSFSQAFGGNEGNNQVPINAIELSSSESQSNPQHENTVNSVDTTALIQPHVLLVSSRQRGNSILGFIRNVPFTYAKIIPDYIFGPNRCALFLSFKYHNLHPNYIHRRIAELKNDFDVLISRIDKLGEKLDKLFEVK